MSIFSKKGKLSETYRHLQYEEGEDIVTVINPNYEDRQVFLHAPGGKPEAIPDEVQNLEDKHNEKGTDYESTSTDISHGTDPREPAGPAIDGSE